MNIQRTDFNPFLFAIFPALFIGARNLNELIISDIVQALFLALLFAIVIIGISAAITRQRNKTVLLSSMLIIYLFLYGPFFEVLNIRFHIQKSILINLCYGLSGIAMLIIYRILQKSSDILNGTNYFLFITSSCFIFLVLANSILTLPSNNKIAVQDFSDSQQWLNDFDSNLVSAKDTAKLPDIYYIILDGYARHDILEQVFNYNNQGFLKSLQQKGFYIAEGSSSNYTMTHLSLASSLNLDYINSTIEKNGNHNYKPYFYLMKNSRLVKILNQSGYQLVTFSSGWGPTNDKWSTSTYHLGQRFPLTAYHKAVLAMTPLRSMIDYDEVNLRLTAFDKILTVPTLSQNPKFCFLHLVMPHPPYLFNKDGALIGAKNSERSEQELYVEQLQFLNTKILKVIDHLVAASPQPPIIILQGDHGTDIQLHDFKKGVPSALQAQERFAIFNAYFGPTHFLEKLYPTITPVNTFRVLLNELELSSLPLLQDKNYFYWYFEDEEVQDLTAIVESSHTVS